VLRPQVRGLLLIGPEPQACDGDSVICEADIDIFYRYVVNAVAAIFYNLGQALHNYLLIVPGKPKHEGARPGSDKEDSDEQNT